MEHISFKNKVVISLLSLLHLLCDLICGYKIIGVLAINFFVYGPYIFIIYNTLAFCFQPVIGIIIDRYRIEKTVLVASFFFLASGLFINIWWLSAILLGMGNQIYHVAGGKICCNISTKKSSHLGVFVSLGAIGLAIGGNLYQYLFIPYLALGLYFALLVACMAMIDPGTDQLENDAGLLQEATIGKKHLLLAVSFLLLAVFIRSFLGKIIYYDFQMNLSLLLLLPAAAAFGKLIGGFIRDRFGSFYTILVSMSLGALSLIAFDHVIVLMMLGLVMINISMPITLFEINKLLPGHEGFNFGLLAAILFPGVLIGMLYEYDVLTYVLVVIAASVLAILSMYYIKRGELRG